MTSDDHERPGVAGCWRLVPHHPRHHYHRRRYCYCLQPWLKHVQHEHERLNQSSSYIVVLHKQHCNTSE